MTARSRGSEGATARRSSGRTRIRPLEFWANERVVYQTRDGDAAPNIVDIQTTDVTIRSRVHQRRLNFQAVESSGHTLSTASIHADAEKVEATMITEPVPPKVFGSPKRAAATESSFMEEVSTSEPLPTVVPIVVVPTHPLPVLPASAKTARLSAPPPRPTLPQQWQGHPRARHVR